MTRLFFLLLLSGSVFADPPIALLDVGVSDITQTSAQIDWHCNVPCTGVYYLSRDPITSIVPPTYTDTNAPGDNNFASPDHSMPITGLLKNTLYHLKISSFLPSGYGIVSPDLTFKTLP